jgi:hypothetical protein
VGQKDFTWESESSAMRGQAGSTTTHRRGGGGIQKQAEKRGLPVHFLSFVLDGNDSCPDDE